MIQVHVVTIFLIEHEWAARRVGDQGTNLLAVGSIRFKHHLRVPIDSTGQEGRVDRIIVPKIESLLIRIYSNQVS